MKYLITTITFILIANVTTAQFNNLSNVSNVGNFQIQQIQTNKVNQNEQQVAVTTRNTSSSRRNRGSQNINVTRGNINIPQTINPIYVDVQVIDNNDVPQQAINFNPSINLDNNIGENVSSINISMPEINAPKIDLSLNHQLKDKEIKPERVPKRINDFIIKTSGGDAVVTKEYSRKRKPAAKNLSTSVKCWWNKHFAHSIKFQFSCECFQF